MWPTVDFCRSSARGGIIKNTWFVGTRECWLLPGHWDFKKVSLFVATNWVHVSLGGGFKHFLFSPLSGDMIQFDEHIFQLS